VDHDDVAGQRGQDESAAPDAAAGGEREADGDEQRAGVEDKAREQRDHDLRPRVVCAPDSRTPIRITSMRSTPTGNRSPSIRSHRQGWRWSRT